MSANSTWQVKPKKLTPTEKLAEESKRSVKVFLEAACKDRLYLLAIVTGGMEHWLKIARKAFAGFLVDDQMLSEMFHFLVQEAGPEPKRQYEELQAAELTALKLDRLRGLADMITDERHLDEVLDRWSGHGFAASERQAIRTQLLLLMKSREMQH